MLVQGYGIPPLLARATDEILNSTLESHSHWNREDILTGRCIGDELTLRCQPRRPTTYFFERVWTIDTAFGAMSGLRAILLHCEQNGDTKSVFYRFANGYATENQCMNCPGLAENGVEAIESTVGTTFRAEMR